VKSLGEKDKKKKYEKNVTRMSGMMRKTKQKAKDGKVKI
jgi:hypothetical protein